MNPFRETVKVVNKYLFIILSYIIINFTTIIFKEIIMKYKIIVLDSGHVAEEGTHTRLVAAGGLYAKMWADYGQAVKWKITHEREEAE